MNPFTESTLAQPQPGVRWRRPRYPMRRSGHRPSRPGAAPDPAMTEPAVETREPPASRRPATASGRGAGAGALIGSVMIALALLMPGGAAATDVNRATSEQLQEVKGIGPKMAQRIIEERGRGGRFASIADLSERVRGIGPKKAASLQESGLIVGAEPAAVAKAPEAGTQAGSDKGAAPRRGR